VPWAKGSQPVTLAPRSKAEGEPKLEGTRSPRHEVVERGLDRPSN